LLDLMEDVLQQPHGAVSRYGGISIHHSGVASDLIARGFAQDEQLGYSLPIQFSDPAGAKSSELQGVGLRLGIAGNELLTPIVVLRNIGTESTVVTGRLPYTQEDGTTGLVSLPNVSLSPNQTDVLDVSRLLHEQNVPWFKGIGSLEFKYSTAPGTVLITALSVGNGNNQVFRMPMWDVAAQRSPTGGYPWYIDGNSSTTVYIKNALETPQKYFVQINYSGGAYMIGLKTLGGGETVNYDLRKIRDEQLPDSRGRVIPLSVSSGQVHWSANGDGMMIGRSEQADLVAGTSSNYACMNCCEDNPYVNSQRVTPASATVATEASSLFTAEEQYQDCYGNLGEFTFVTDATWASSAPSVAKVESLNGNVTGVGAGTATITASWHENVSHYNPATGGCVGHQNNYSKSASVTVTAGIDHIQYQSGSDFIDVDGTLFVLNGTAVTFKAVPNPPSATFPSGQPVWSGTSGISGTGQTASVTFNTTSTSSTDFKTVIATGGVSVTINVVVIELTGQLTPDDNFTGRSTTRLGIHERVTLGFAVTPGGITSNDLGGIQWQKTSGDGNLTNNASDGVGTYRAPDSTGSTTLQLKMLAGPSKDSGPSRNIDIVTPSDGYESKQPTSGIKHFQGFWSCGFLGDIYVLPKDVSFRALFFKEEDVGASASGWLSNFLSNAPHCNPSCGSFFILGGDSQVGSRVNSDGDAVFSGAFDDSQHPYGTGTVTWSIPWKYSVDNSNWNLIRTADQTATSTSTGRCTISKQGSGSFSKEASDPSSSW
jgi:hypothetical protein